MGGIKFTFAELECMLHLEAAWSDMRRVLEFPDADLDLVVRAGIASLVARDYAQVQGGEYMLSSEIAKLAHRMVEGKITVTLVALHSSDVGVVVLTECQDGQRMMATLEAPGVLRLTLIDQSESPRDRIMKLVDAALSNDGAVGVTYPGPIAVVVERKGEQWTMGDVVSGSPETLQATTRDEVYEKIRRLSDGVLWSQVQAEGLRQAPLSPAATQWKRTNSTANELEPQR